MRGDFDEDEIDDFEPDAVLGPRVYCPVCACHGTEIEVARAGTACPFCGEGVIQPATEQE